MPGTASCSTAPPAALSATCRLVPIGGPYDSATQAGWTAGAGVEAAFAPNWTAKVEYLYVDFAGLSCTAGGCGTGTTVTLTENIVRAGINYKFSW